MKQIFASLSIAAIAALLMPSLALAQFKDSEGNVHFQTGLTAKQKITISTVKEYQKKLKANACGLITISPPKGAALPVFDAGGLNVNVATLPVQTIPTCSNGTLKETRTAHFKTAEGKVVLVGFAAGEQLTIDFNDWPTTRSATANDCGFAKFSQKSMGGNNFTYNGQAYTYSSLPVQEPSRCYHGKKFVFQQ